LTEEIRHNKITLEHEIENHFQQGRFINFSLSFNFLVFAKNLSILQLQKIESLQRGRAEG